MGPYTTPALNRRYFCVNKGRRNKGHFRKGIPCLYIYHLVYCILSMYPFLLTNFLTNIPIKSGNIDTFLYYTPFETGAIKAGVKGAGVIRVHKVTRRNDQKRDDELDA